jgi:hypothetical protein
LMWVFNCPWLQMQGNRVDEIKSQSKRLLGVVA